MTTDAKILTALRAARDDGVSGADLSDRLGISRAAIWARIEDLRKLGYEIEASPHRGYQLLNDPDLLNADDLQARLGKDTRIGRDIRVFQETDSTNDVVERLARDRVPEGVVVFAESQLRGRGRLGRKWSSPAGRGLWFSVLLRPDLHPQEATRLTIAGATALWRAILEQTGIRAEVKWPNDLLIGGRKVAGILTEMNAELDHVNYVILGIGVDVNQTAADFPADLRRIATSLRIETRQPIARAALAAAILQELDRDYARVVNGQFAAVADEWEQHCTTIGRQVIVQIGERRLRGRAEALHDDGTLLLRTEHGHVERVMGGDVSLEE